MVDSTADPLVKNETQEDNTLAANEVIIRAFAKVDSVALGLSLGTVLGLSVFFATILLILKDDPQANQFFILINHYFIGYSMTFFGSILGLIYGFLFGFVIGWIVAFLRNAITSIYLYFAKFKARMMEVNKFIDYP